MGSVDVKDMEKLVYWKRLKSKKIPKYLIKEYQKRAEELISEFPWLEGKVYLEGFLDDYRELILLG